MELAHGRAYANGALPEFDLPTRRSMYEQLVDTLADLHVIEPDAAGLGDFGRPGNYFERQVARWTRQYRDSQTDYIPEVERLISLLSPPGGRKLGRPASDVVTAESPSASPGRPA